MSADQQAPERQLTLAEFEEMFADFLNGAISLAQLRQCLVEVIDNDPDALPAVQEQVDSAMYSGRLPEQTWENLVAEIDHLVSENTPTEWSDDTAMTPESEDAPLLDPSNDGPMLFDEDLTEPPVLVEAVEEPAPAPAPAPTIDLESAAPEAPAESMAQTETTQPMPDTTELPPGTVLEDRYVLVSRTEHGSMGTVYKALDRQQKEAGAEDPWVAIKLITAEFGKHTAAIDTLRNEAQIGCRLKHPNVARSHALHEDGEHLFISMEWLDGESLSQLLDRKRPHTLPRDQALKIIEGLATGLVYAHAQGIVHADIKPANVFITQGGEVKLLDFGIARANDGMPLTGGLLAKTPAYASCEVLEGDNPGFQDDLFSLAAVTYRVLTGQRPFGSANALEAEGEQRTAVPVPGLSPQQWRALNSALAWRREQRSADVQSFLTEFFGEEEIVLASPESTPVSAPPAAVPRVETPAAKTEPDMPAEAAPTAVEPEPTDTVVSISEATEAVIEPEADEETRSTWLRPALAAGVVGLAVAAAWTLFGSGETQEPAVAAVRASENTVASTGAEAKSLVNAAQPEPELVESDIEPAEVQARISAGPSGEELMLFMPGSGIPIAGDQFTDDPTPDAPVSDLDDATSEVSAEAEPADEEPAEDTSTQSTAVAAAEPVPADEPPAERREPEPAPEPEPQQAAEAIADAAEEEPAAGAAAPTAVAAVESPTVEAGVNEAPAVAERAADQPAEEEPAAQESSAREAPEEKVAASEPEVEPAEPEPVEADTVTAPAEAMLASTLSLAMVSPDTRQREAQQMPEQDTVPIPERAEAPEPDAYGPPPELAPPRIEEVLLSSLKFKRFVEPKFPRRARDSGLTGWVDLRFLVTAEGGTTDIEVLDAQPGGAFDEAAVAAVERWRFKPRQIDGEAVPSRTQIRLRFE